MKTKTIVAIALAGVVLLGSSGAYATTQIARSSAIGENDAINFAYVDAGISPDDAVVTRVEFDFEHGKFVYEVEFMAEGVEYEYTIDSASGEVIGKTMETIPGYVPDVTKVETTTPVSGGTGTIVNTDDLIGIEKAKGIALEKAALSESDVVFSKAKLSRDDGKIVYDIEFYVLEKAEYDYEIDALTGAVLEESVETWEKPAVTPGTSAPSGASGASAPAAPQQSAPTTGQSTPASSQSSSSTAQSGTSSPATISLESAKQIALSRAGYSAGQVVFEKAKLDTENGRLVYDIEFYVSGVMEYDCEVDAYTGAVLDESYDKWEADDAFDDYDDYYDDDDFDD